jgi:CHAT domain-containing protein
VAELPEAGVLVLAVDDAGEGARAGLRSGDVLVRYDDRDLTDDRVLRDVTAAVASAVENGTRPRAPVSLTIWRRGVQSVLSIAPGLLGIQAGRGGARAAFTASLDGARRLERSSRSGDLERIARLPALTGARAETEAVAAVFAAQGLKVRTLLGEQATEPAIFELAPKARFVHFACHGIAEEYAGQSLSMLVLSQPERVLPGDDGLLKVGDLLGAWRGRLSACRLVVLSACRTNVAKTLRDESPQALPIGLLFAGVPSVISSLWAVDDASTKELMTDFYGRLLAGETDRLAAFTKAKQALRRQNPDPFRWAPFLYLGAPD